RAALLTDVFPVLRGVSALCETQRTEIADPQELRSRLFAAVRELFARLTERSAVTLVIDDLQSADSGCLAMLAQLTAQPDAPPLLVVGTWRPIAGNPIEHGLARMPLPWQRVALGPLETDHAQELAAVLLDRAGLRDTNQATALAAEAGGHPLFIDALVQ